MDDDDCDDDDDDDPMAIIALSDDGLVGVLCELESMDRLFCFDLAGGGFHADAPTIRTSDYQVFKLITRICQ